MNETRVSDRSKLSAAFFCLLGGTLGFHKFYVGKHAQGFMHIALMTTSIILASGLTGSLVLALAGFLFMAAGAWVLVDLVRILSNNFRDAQGRYVMPAGFSRPATSPVAPPAPPRQPDQRQLQQRILLCAKQEGGAVAPTNIAMRTSLDLDEAKDHLEALVDQGHAELHPTRDGRLVYVFRDLLTDERRADLEPL